MRQMDMYVYRACRTTYVQQTDGYVVLRMCTPHFALPPQRSRHTTLIRTQTTRAHTHSRSLSLSLYIYIFLSATTVLTFHVRGEKVIGALAIASSSPSFVFAVPRVIIFSVAVFGSPRAAAIPAVVPAITFFVDLHHVLDIVLKVIHDTHHIGRHAVVPVVHADTSNRTLAPPARGR